jgi:thiamine kinase-like enzyme
MTTLTDDLHPLLVYLSTLESTPGAWMWQGWRLHCVDGGMNNRLFCARGDDLTLAIKFTLSDDRDRAGREWHTLHALAEAGLAIAPQPILLDRERYALPVVVQSWVEGEPLLHPPHDDADWDAILAHMIAVHQLTEDRAQRSLPAPVLNASTAAEALAQIHWQLNRLPDEDRPPRLMALIHQVDGCHFPSWEAPTMTLCRADPNIRNFIRRAGPWASVDWEYSGLGDPAFDIADLIAHIAHLDVPAARWHWFVAQYASRSADAGCRTRIETYLPLMLVWWTVRIVRYLRETGQGLDNRLVEPTPGWRAAKEEQLFFYFDRAERALDPWR